MIRFIFLIVTFIMFVSCHKQSQTTGIAWKNGDNIENLNKINAITTAKTSTSVFYKEQLYQISAQSIDSVLVESTFVKKRTNVNNVISFAEAIYYETPYINKKSQKKINVFKLIEKINSISAPLALKNYQMSNVYKHSESGLQSVSLFEYELSDGSLWNAEFNNEHILLKNNRLGSGFSMTEANIYQKGPKLSRLTDIVLKELDTAPTLSNASIFVDSESTKKIITIESQLKFDPKDERFDQLQVFYYLDYIQNWMKINLSVRFPDKLLAVVNVGFPNKTNTAFYYQNKIRLGRGDDITYSMLSLDPSVVYHESFHALIDGLAHLPYEGEGGSMNEAFADYFTCVALNSPYLGESSYLKGPFKRSVATLVKLDEKTGGLYHDSAIVSGLFWEIKEKLSAEKSLLVATETLSLLNPLSQFSDFNKLLNEVVLKNLSADDRQTLAVILKSRGFIYE